MVVYPWDRLTPTRIHANMRAWAPAPEEDRTRPHPRPIAPRRFMRKALWISGTIVLLVVVALVAAVLLIDVNRFREPIQSQLEQKGFTGRWRWGTISLHLIPLAITVSDCSIGESAAFRNGPAVCHCQGDRRARRLVSAAAQTDSSRFSRA